MVINYKSQNDNTCEDHYKISNKDQLINCIQNANIFCRFDCKSWFCKLKWMMTLFYKLPSTALKDILNR